MRLLVCGSRDFTNRKFLFETLDAAFIGSVDLEVVIHGGAAGADTLAGEWAELHGIPVEKYPADWKTNGRSAGPIRNQHMLAVGKPTCVMAFINKPLVESRGTAHMISIANKAGLTVFIEGTVL